MIMWGNFLVQKPHHKGRSQQFSSHWTDEGIKARKSQVYYTSPHTDLYGKIRPQAS